jgi:hypothetical protein
MEFSSKHIKRAPSSGCDGRGRERGSRGTTAAEKAILISSSSNFKFTTCSSDDENENFFGSIEINSGDDEATQKPSSALKSRGNFSQIIYEP